MDRERKILIGVAAIVAVAVGVFVAVAGSGDSPTDTGGQAQLVREDSFQSAKQAKVTVVEFGDLQCPACAQAQPGVEQLKAKYPDRVNIVFRHFPLKIHRNAVAAANAAEAAGAQGKFFEYTTLLYNNQTQWSEQGNPVSLFMAYAQQLGLDGNAIKEAVERQQYKAKIDRDLADGESLKVRATPTFYVNGSEVESVDAAVKAAEAAAGQS